MDGLLTIDPVACLRYDHSAGSISLRFPAAEMFALAGQAEQAMEILKRPVKYQVDPPSGGWRNPPGISSPPDANQPRTFTSPSEADLQKLPLELLRTMSRVKTAATIVPQLSRPFCSDLVSKIQTSKKPEDLQRCVKELAGALAITVKAIDPLPRNVSSSQPLPQREVNKETVSPVGAAFREALKSNEVAKRADVLISEGIQPSMLQATNAKLLDFLFDLATFTLDRFKEVAGAQAAGATASNFANSLEARRVYDMKPYAQRLREKYPKP
ncbi:MAG: hypothetical protein HY318_08700, partial [Armatimonadetes bacterium]|nr:hypothetical protein [Armatimonadota bacterium]